MRPAINTEWLLTDGVGGFALGTALGTPTRKYHALLCAAMPARRRVVLVSSVLDTLSIDGRRYTLTPPHAGPHADQFAVPALDPAIDAAFEAAPNRIEWRFAISGVTLIRTLTLTPRTASLCYRAQAPPGRGVSLSVAPIVPIRHFHATRPPGWPGATARFGTDAICLSDGEDTLRLTANARALVPAVSLHEPRFLPHEHDRGMDALDTPWTPVAFEWSAQPGGCFDARLGFAAEHPGHTPLSPPPPESRSSSPLHTHQNSEHDNPEPPPSPQPPTEPASAAGSGLAAACLAFVAKFSGRPSVIAGFPWFSDWGRDTMICLPGLRLAGLGSTDLLDILATFAGAQRGGIIPNRFDDHDAAPHYNTADASLWFINAALDFAADASLRARVIDRFAAPMLAVIEAYAEGVGGWIDPESTSPEDRLIWTDTDGLLVAGSPNTQLTWMDARREGHTFTPRHGKAVELNALWISALRGLGGLLERRELSTEADRASAAFRAAFIRPDGSLFDRLEPDPTRDAAFTPRAEHRPNQVFAASLERSPLTRAERAALVAACRRAGLVTSRGLRTLAPNEAGYRPQFRGSLVERDAAYHQGTVWPWLAGPFAEATLRAEGFAPAARERVCAWLLPIAAEANRGCIGHLPEVFDGDSPADRAGDGCPAQAWSACEIYRALRLAGP